MLHVRGDVERKRGSSLKWRSLVSEKSMIPIKATDVIKTNKETLFMS
jgi:hypothetical protein